SSTAIYCANRRTTCRRYKQTACFRGSIPQDTCGSSTTTSKTFLDYPPKSSKHPVPRYPIPVIPCPCRTSLICQYSAAATQERGVRYRNAPKQLPRSNFGL